MYKRSYFCGCIVCLCLLCICVVSMILLVFNVPRCDIDISTHKVMLCTVCVLLAKYLVV